MRHQFWMSNLDGDQAIELLVLSQINDAESAFAQRPLDSVAANSFGDQIGPAAAFSMRHIGRLLNRIGGVLGCHVGREVRARDCSAALITVVRVAGIGGSGDHVSGFTRHVSIGEG